jgi:hypothetical protein
MARTDPERSTYLAIIEMIRHKCFYGHIVQQMSKVFMSGESADVQTMAVGRAPGE